MKLVHDHGCNKNTSWYVSRSGSMNKFEMEGRSHCHWKRNLTMTCSGVIFCCAQCIPMPQETIEQCLFHVCMRTGVHTWWGHFTCLPGGGLHDDGQCTEHHDHWNIKQLRMLHWAHFLENLFRPLWNQCEIQRSGQWSRYDTESTFKILSWWTHSKWKNDVLKVV